MTKTELLHFYKQKYNNLLMQRKFFLHNCSISTLGSDYTIPNTEDEAVLKFKTDFPD